MKDTSTTDDNGNIHDTDDKNSSDDHDQDGVINSNNIKFIVLMLCLTIIIIAGMIVGVYCFKITRQHQQIANNRHGRNINYRTNYRANNGASAMNDEHVTLKSHQYKDSYDNSIPQGVSQLSS